MKKLIVTIAAVFVSITALPHQAEAAPHRHHIGHSYTYCSGHASCGCPVYKRRVVVGYDCHHRPVYRYYSVPIVHRCRSYIHPGRYHHHHHSHHRYYHGHHHRVHSSYTIRGRHGWITIRR